MRRGVEVRFGMRKLEFLQNFRLEVEFDEGLHFLSLHCQAARFVERAGDPSFFCGKDRVRGTADLESLFDQIVFDFVG